MQKGPDLLTSDDISKLLARVALGDRRAFDQIYDQTSAKLFGVALRLLRNRAEAEECVQEVYIKIWHRADRYSVSEASAMSWLIAIARNQAIDRLRQRKEKQDSLDDASDIKDNKPDPEENTIAGSERRRIEVCIDRLDEEKSAAVRGAYLEGYSYQELATRSNVPLNTMRTWLRRSLIKLKECLEE